MCNYNLFRHADRTELICAVPEVRPVPAFITGPPWSFVGRVRDYASGSSGFDHQSAEVSVHYNGFYLFQLVNVSDLKAWVDQGRRRPSDEGAPVCGKEQPKEILRLGMAAG
ncbi:hypothetical protein [Microvirga sp. VF16]|uniref:hypothetical protein n=1 Tax=Microvirga sp. VF16 TaxID=2807101 RepID=UPI00193CB76F|nr:hypothetical protein [Microvirga sp. VF16]QRM35930.1 hypothetical protein JO965_46980 [Microvirga sp. VF16]